MLVRYAKEKDFPEIIEIGQQCWNLHREKMPEHFSEKYPFDEGILRTLVSSSGHKVFVLEDSLRDVLGFAIVSFDKYYGHMTFEDICIDSVARSVGRGRYFVENIFEMVKKDCPSIGSWECTIYGFNDICTNLAESLGHKLIYTTSTYEFPTSS